MYLMSGKGIPLTESFRQPSFDFEYMSAIFTANYLVLGMYSSIAVSNDKGSIGRVL